MQNPETEQPAITFLNMSGDITITWEKESEEAILELVRQKMEQGFSFFVLKPRLLGLLGNRKVAARNVYEIVSAGQAIVKDQDAAGFLANLHDTAVEQAVASGKAHLVKADKIADIETARRARTAEEAIGFQTVAVRRVVGG